MSVKFSNNAYGTLSAGISASDTSLTLSSGQGARFPTLASGDYFYATLIDTSNNLEIIKVTARASDVLTIVRAQDNTTARAYSIGDRVELRMVAAAISDPSGVSDQANSSTGYFGMPSGTTAQRPGSATAGYTRYNTTTGSLEFYDGTNWIATNLIPTVNSVTGTIYAGASSTLTLSLTNATDVIDVMYYEGGTLLATESGVTVTSGSATSTVPSAVYGQTAGDTISIQIANQDGTPSSNTINKTVAGLPTGGTITSSGSYRYHTFTSSSTFTVPSGFSATADYLVVAGGGNGGGANYGGNGYEAGGGGAGGYLSGSTSISATSYTITVGAGGSGGGANGSNSSALGVTAIGGGAGGGISGNSTSVGNSGGSGGGSGYNTQSFASGTSGQGFAGGRGVEQSLGGSTNRGGGGGGASEVGNADGEAQGGDGKTWLNGVTYAGGGGGANIGSFNGGAGGGGRGGYSIPDVGTAGSANTGGGGGGAYNSSPMYGSSGGSGIVIIRYQL